MSWPLQQLGNVAERVTVGHVGPTSQYYIDDGVPLLRTQNVGSQKLEMDDVKRITPEFHASLKKSQLKTGDVVISRVISSEVRCAQVPPEFDGANCANIIAVRPGPHLDSSYLVHYLTSPIVQGQLMKRKVGSAQSVVNTGVLKKWEVPLPPLPEQKRIAAILDKADEVRRKRAETIRLTEELLKSAFLEMFGDPVTNPKGWEVKKLGELIDMETGVAFKSADFRDEGIRLCRGANVFPGYLDWGDVQHWSRSSPVDDRYQLRREDVILAMDRPWISTGLKLAQVKEADLPAYLVQRVARIRPRDETLSAAYIYNVLRQPGFERHCRSHMTETTVPHISPKDIRSFGVPVPEKRMLSKFTSLSRVLGETSNRMESAESSSLAATLTQRAFRGEL